MIEIKTFFNRKGITYTQLYKNDVICVYGLERLNCNGETSHWFEVFRRTVRKPSRWHDEEWEWYPNDEAFGIWAWSCSNIKSLEKVLKNKFPMEDHDEILQICRHV